VSMDRADYWATIRRQDESLAETMEAARAVLDAGELPTWQPGEPLAVVAMGASTMAAEFLVHEARRRDRVVLNWSAADWREIPELLPSLVIGISESGRSPETIDALGRCRGHRIVVTNIAGSPATDVADTVVPLGGVADAGVYVSGYTSTLVALALIGERLGLEGAADGLDDAPALMRSWLPIATAGVEEFLARRRPDGAATMLDCVGAGSSFAAAAETALLLREAGRTPSASFPTDQYLHGPAESMPGDVWGVVYGNGRADELVARMVEVGLPVLHVSPHPVAGAIGVTMPATSPVVASILEVVVGQVLAGRLGDRWGHEMGTFRHDFAGTKLPIG
jgi:glucosamine--fructose-6-phosphate aminotransferase (isomerizing)